MQSQLIEFHSFILLLPFNRNQSKKKKTIHKNINIFYSFWRWFVIYNRIQYLYFTFFAIFVRYCDTHKMVKMPSNDIAYVVNFEIFV